MFVVANRIAVPKGQEAVFEARFKGRARLVDQAPGFVRNEVLRPVQEGLPYVVLTHWRDRASFEAWVNSPAFREAHRTAGGSAERSEATVLELYEVVETTDPI
jgi:heme-degrading monooxygenase HmoA